MVHLHELIRETKYKNYHVDVEYNRNKNGQLKTVVKTIKGLEDKIVRINCDLIVHSRGRNVCQDNLIAIEMKKSNRPQTEKDSDRDRLIALTKNDYDDIWSYDGQTLPEHVCRYKLGVFYEVNYRTEKILLEYYVGGCFYSKKEVNYNNFNF